MKNGVSGSGVSNFWKIKSQVYPIFPMIYAKPLTYIQIQTSLRRCVEVTAYLTKISTIWDINDIFRLKVKRR